MRDFCNRELGRYKTPKVIRFVDDLPRGPSGKVQRLASLLILAPELAADPRGRLPLIVAPIARWLPELREPGAVRADLLAGLTGAIVVLPQGVAFATLAGMPPEYGLYAAMVPCVVAALFGSSRLMMTGPANAISLTTLALIAPLATPGSRHISHWC